LHDHEQLQTSLAFKHNQQPKHQNNIHLDQDNMIYNQIQHKNPKLNLIRLGFTSLELEYKRMEVVFDVCESCGGGCWSLGWWLTDGWWLGVAAAGRNSSWGAGGGCHAG